MSDHCVEVLHLLARHLPLLGLLNSLDCGGKVAAVGRAKLRAVFGALKKKKNYQLFQFFFYEVLANFLQKKIGAFGCR
jgi:hypothetical protein